MALTPPGGYHDGTATLWPGRDGRYDDTTGENSRTSKLTEEQVRDIKSRPRSGPNRQTHAQVAEDYVGVISARQIALIRQGRYWAHVKPHPTTTDTEHE